MIQTPNKEVWTTEFLRRVLKAHNAAYHTKFSVCGSAESIYPELRWHTNWDWVCRDGVSGHEAAIEVKRLTSQPAEETHSELAKVGQAICAKVQDKILGIFSLFVDLPSPKFEFVGSAQRKKLVERLAGFVVENGKKLPGDKTETIRVEAGDQLSEVLPAGTWLDLYRHGSPRLRLAARQHDYLQVCFSWGMFGATATLAGEELVEFRKLIKKSNQQLGVAKQMGIQDALLVLIEVGFSVADPNALDSTVRRLAPGEYPNINHIYLVGYTPPRRIGGIASPPSPKSVSP